MENTNWVFSPSESIFYYVGLRDLYEKNDNWPADAVAVTDEVRSQFSTPPSGKMLGASDGMPAWIDVPPLSHDEIRVIAEQKKSTLKTVADSEIAWRQDAVDADIAKDEEISALKEWKKYRVLLMRVDTTDPDWPTVPGILIHQSK